MRYCTQCRTPYDGEERFCPIDGGAIVRAEEKDDPLVGVKLDGRYLVRGRLGQGGMGVVYEAHHVALDKRVAIKFLLEKYTEDREVLARFHQEARTASRIGHENIIDIVDIGEAPDGRSYIVMELLEGTDLARVLADAGAMHPERAVRIIRQVLRGLAAAHGKGIIHRDMKPENVFVTSRDDGSDFVKIMDFGISKIIDAHDSKVRLTETGAVVGTPIYMAPEQARAEQTIDQRVDIYAVGVMLFEMLCGRPPFMANSYLELVTQHLFDPPPPLRSVRPELPAILEQITLKALAKAPADRWESAAELAAAIPDPGVFTGGAWDSMSTLGGSAAELSLPRPAVVAAPTAAPAPKPARRSKAPFAIVGVALVAAAAMIALTVGLGGEDDDDPGQAEPIENAAPAPDPEPPPAPSVVPLETVLEIDSRPQGATVFLDGAARGETPLTVSDLEPGVHILRVEKDGYQTVETSRTLTDGETGTFFAALAPSGSSRESKVTKTGERKTRRREQPKPKPEPKPPKNPEPKPEPKPEKKPEPKPEPRPEKKPNPYLEKKPSPYN